MFEAGQMQRYNSTDTSQEKKTIFITENTVTFFYLVWRSRGNTHKKNENKLLNKTNNKKAHKILPDGALFHPRDTAMPTTKKQAQSPTTRTLVQPKLEPIVNPEGGGMGPGISKKTQNKTKKKQKTLGALQI